MEEKWITMKINKKSHHVISVQVWESYAIAFQSLAEDARMDVKGEFDFVAYKASATNHKLISKKDNR